MSNRASGVPGLQESPAALGNVTNASSAPYAEQPSPAPSSEPAPLLDDLPQPPSREARDLSSPQAQAALEKDVGSAEIEGSEGAAEEAASSSSPDAGVERKKRSKIRKSTSGKQKTRKSASKSAGAEFNGALSLPSSEGHDAALLAVDDSEKTMDIECAVDESFQSGADEARSD